MNWSSTPIVAITRCGIGIFDEQWWESRIELLRAVTFPSLSRFGHLDFTWVILLDSAVPNFVYERLQALVQKRGASFIRFQFVENPSFMKEGIYNAIKSVVGPTQRCLALRIDDDDAVALDFFENALDIAFDRPEEPAVISLAKGLAFNAPERSVGELIYPSHPCNTTFYGTAAELNRVIFRSHVKWLASAEGAGFRAVRDESKSQQFLYTYHKQGDGSYENRVSRIAEWRDLGQSEIDRFGVDLEALDQWIEKQRSLPQTVGLTWRRAQGELWKLERLKKEMQLLKRQIVSVNSKIFDPSTPFLYMNKPSDGAEVEAGTVVFTGTSNVGARVSLSVTGSSGKYRVVDEVSTNRSNGNFRLVGRFKPGLWNIRVESQLGEGGEAASRQINYQIRAI